MAENAQAGLILDYSEQELQAISDELEVRLGPEINALRGPLVLLYGDIQKALEHTKERR